MPLYVAGALFAGAGPMLDALAGCAVQLRGPDGQHWATELSLDLVARELSADLAAQLAAYYRLCGTFWDNLAAGRPGGSYLVLHRPILHLQQVDTKTKGKVMLREQLEALTAMPGLDAVVRELLVPEPDFEQLMVAGEPFNMAIDRSGQWAQARLEVVTDAPWPAALGGAPTRAEVRRYLVLKTNYAQSRDRALRRLMALRVEVQEVWPDPAPLADRTVKPGPPDHNL